MMTIQYHNTQCALLGGLHWNLEKYHAFCENVLIPWRGQDESKEQCAQFCLGEGSVVLTHKPKTGNCMCCKDPTTLEKDQTIAADHVVYRYQGMSALSFSLLYHSCCIII